MNRVLAITVSVTLVCLATILLTIFLYSRLDVIIEAFPVFLDKFYKQLNNCVVWISQNSNFSTRNINAYIADTKTEALNNSRSSIGVTLSALGNGLVNLFLIPVYVFMLLFYQPLLLDFIRKIFGEINRKEVNEVIQSTKTLIQRYMFGLLLEVAILAVLNSIGLLMIGIKYAIVLGILGAILNIIPYLGGIVAMAIYCLIALVTKESASYILYVAALYSVIQLIDNNYIVPKVVGSKVKINALVAIISVIAGGALWGIPGMFLSIPITAILKVVFDHIESLKPWGELLGDTMPTIGMLKSKNKK